MKFSTNPFQGVLHSVRSLIAKLIAIYQSPRKAMLAESHWESEIKQYTASPF